MLTADLNLSLVKSCLGKVLRANRGAAVIDYVLDGNGNWLLVAVVIGVDGEIGLSLKSEWNDLQYGMWGYLKNAESYHFGREEIGEQPTLTEVKELRIYQDDSRVLENFPFDQQEIQLAMTLIDDPPKLSAKLERFKSRLRTAVDTPIDA